MGSGNYKLYCGGREGGSPRVLNRRPGRYATGRLLRQERLRQGTFDDNRRALGERVAGFRWVDLELSPPAGDIDLLIATHTDLDHVGGLVVLLDQARHGQPARRRKISGALVPPMLDPLGRDWPVGPAIGGLRRTSVKYFPQERLAEAQAWLL